MSSTPLPPILLMNLGTPQSPEPADVKRYLDEFLTDPEVITFSTIKNSTVASVLRWLLVRIAITPWRAPRSAESYQKVWTSRGSPLLFHSQDLQKQLQLQWPSPVLLAMRYGRPSLTEVLDPMSEKILRALKILPLYPQYSSSAWRSAAVAVKRYYQKRNLPPPTFIAPFNRHPAFVAAWRKILLQSLRDFSADEVLFSYHGLPVSQIQSLDPSQQYCLKQADCCLGPKDPPQSQDCYRHECYWLSRQIAEPLLTERQIPYSVAFQSRLGRQAWIQPYTDKILEEKAKAGIKKILVLSPSFVSDCLETLEEIAIRAAEDFRLAGGQELRLAPSLNSSPDWVNALANIIESGDNRNHV